MRLFPLTPSHEKISTTEETILSQWKKNNIFQKTIQHRDPENAFIFFDGPPFATGTPHYGHILAGTLKDAIPRYKTMQGYFVERKWGWDCHGVPVEFQVEKENQIGGKPGIEAMGVGNFNELCRSVVLRYRDQWEATVERMGRFVDFKNDYKTMNPEFMESVWWVFGQLWNKGLIYEGEKVIAYSPKLATPLSNFEAGENYKDVDDPAVTVKFKLKKNPFQKHDEEVFVLAWTTTPWTLPSNLALAVNPNIQYIKTKPIEGKSYIVAETLLENHFKDPIDIERHIDGQSLVGIQYDPLFPFFKTHENAFRILSAEFVSDTSGTGIVHMAPNFGEDDSITCLAHNIQPLVLPIDQNGYFNESIPGLTGKYFRYDREVGEHTRDNANEWVLQELKNHNTLFHRSQIRHSYPHCWRTDCALMYRGIKTWFVDIQKIKPDLIALNQEISWIPEYLKEGRFRKGLQSAPDWAISRNRYWGTPIPIWKCDKTGEIQVIQSRSELERMSGQSVSDLHRHFIDELTWENPRTGGIMRRIPEVLDCWFESGSMPYASQHYPFKKDDIFFNNTLITVRHGESENNVTRTLASMPSSASQYGLTEKGRQQILSVRNEYSDIDLIFTSPLRRTKETAQLFAEIGSIPVLEDDRLREIDFGDLDNKSSDEAHCFADNHNILEIPYPNGESIQDCEARVVDFLKDINTKYTNKKILIVSHGHTIQLMHSWAQKQPPQYWQDNLPNGKPLTLVPSFPAADFIAEGLDQTRCWFYNLHVLGTALFGKNIYKNVITNGIIQAEDGSKMSKSKKNYPDPAHIFNEYGADAIRFYLLNSPVARGENLRFSEHGVAEVLKSVLLPLRSAYQFFATYANIDEWNPTRFKAVSYALETTESLTKKEQQDIKTLSASLDSFDALYISPFENTNKTAETLKDFTHFAGDIVIDDRLQNLSTDTKNVLQEHIHAFFLEKSKTQKGKTIAFVAHPQVIQSLERHLHNKKDPGSLQKFPIPQSGTAKTFFTLPDPKTELDSWILSELQTLIQEFQENFDAYNLEGGLRLIPEFIDKLNNWYLRRSRRRFWASGMNEEKQSGYETLHFVLLQLSKILAPVCPFIAEKLYQDLGGGESVHLELFPSPLHQYINKASEEKTSLSREIVSLAAGIRARKKIKLRQPLQKLQFMSTNTIDLDFDIIREEANVKEVEILPSLDGVAQQIIRIDAKKVGRKFGKKVQDLIQAGKDGRFTMNADKSITVLDETLSADEYSIGFICQEGIEADSSARTVVLLNTDISENLHIEGFSREIIRTLQDLRKTKGFSIADHISVRYYTQSPTLKKAFTLFGHIIGDDVLADEMIDGGDIPSELKSDILDIAGEKGIFVLEKIAN